MGNPKCPKIGCRGMMRLEKHGCPSKDVGGVGGYNRFWVCSVCGLRVPVGSNLKMYR